MGTGLIYTPPSYSDHIPVSVLFTHEIRNPLRNADDSKARKPWRDNLTSHTKQAQPWLFQPSIGAFFRGSRVARTDSVVAAAAPAITCKAASPPIPSAPVVASTESTPEKLTNKGAVDDSAAGTATSMECAHKDSPSGKKARDAQKGVSSTGSAVPAPAPTLALPGAVTMEKP